MADFDFSNENLSDFGLGSKFLPLGQKPTNQIEINHIQHKINHIQPDNESGVWATIGWMNDDDFQLNGKIKYSKVGNEDYDLFTLRMVNEIRKFLGEGKGFSVTERFIDLSDISFDFSMDGDFEVEKIPELRLTLFVRPDEGAIVYYQYCDEGDFRDPDSQLEFIQPEATDSSYSSNRDRLHYYFPILPSYEIEENRGKIKLTDNKRKIGFYIKILTYKRNNKVAKELMDEAIHCINEASTSLEEKRAILIDRLFPSLHPYKAVEKLGYGKYRILKLNIEDNQFYEVNNQMTIDADAKTILLNHGTFVTTSESFGELYNNSTTLVDLINDSEYEQILAFDHQTISHDIDTNLRELYQRLEGVKFSKPVSLIGTSRGALVCTRLCTDPKNEYFKVDKILTFSGAYGVGFLVQPKAISVGLSVLRVILRGSPSTFVISLAQFSAKFIRGLPGLDAMNPENQVLAKMLEDIRTSGVLVHCVAADWKPFLAPKHRRLFSRVLDISLRIWLGRKHDWVVNFQNQQLAHNSNLQITNKISSVHVKNFDLSYVKPNTHNIILTFFN